ncbi:hypothetical protein GCM10009733_042970 [Nonomuraea maheshkhaliensis]|uniref:Uncharacterized protein n=1 Tax=Nonomuraea maheshkhaliensis TaxID=419590 RepID=A0ABP4RDB6_9ACTN
MGIEIIALVAGSAAAGALSALPEWVRGLLQRRAEVDEVAIPAVPTIESRADELAEILKRSTTLLSELTAEVQARTATAMEMEAKAKHAENLAAMHEEQRQAVEKLLDARLEARLKESGKTSFRQGMWLNIISGAFFFAAGVVVTLLIGG